MPPERATSLESTNSIERARGLERTMSRERAKGLESTIWQERAKRPESTGSAERAIDAEGTKEWERTATSSAEVSRVLSIAAVDPGATTGVVFGIFKDDSYDIYVYEVVRLNDLYELLEKFRPHVVVSERYETRPFVVLAKSGHAPSAEAIGVLRLWAERNGAEFVLQPPSERKAVGKEVLRVLGLDDKALTGKPHAQDAVRHLAAYLMKMRQRGMCCGEKDKAHVSADGK